MNAKGFSLIELMVAMIILTVGVLGLAASARYVTQMTGSGGRYGASSVVASSRFEQLRAGGCAALAAGSATTGKYSESWAIAVSGLLRTVTLTISYNDGRGTRSAVFATTISCAPSV
ncbi:MAG: prepilin-type N-terminal cleavage/methylation domain-containing protein [Gemmatimonadales bacterium]|nr:prepilin-type N-terminal cleavage/methylation domain-containing protein [Gemmatimonadales bacterium]